jgi:hypothetical protein
MALRDLKKNLNFLSIKTKIIFAPLSIHLILSIEFHKGYNILISDTFVLHDKELLHVQLIKESTTIPGKILIKFFVGFEKDKFKGNV